MSPLTSISTCLKKYADFSGRARPAEYWWFALALTIVFVVLEITLIQPRVANALDEGNSNFLNFGPGVPIMTALGLAVLLPTLAAATRRLHDSGKSGAYLALWFVPIVGEFIVLVLLVLPGTRGPNEYGVDPRG